MGIVISDEIEEYRKYIKSHLNKKRYWHSINVSIIASSLAMLYDVDIYAAQVAGILHDCAKGIEYEELIRLCNKHNITITDYEANNPELLHSKYGAYIAEHKLGIDDIDIVKAISAHTTGHEDMTMLEKIIFVADYIEPARTGIPDLEYIRKCSYIDIDEAVLRIYKCTIDYLKASGKDVDSETSQAYEYYCNIVEAKR